MLATAGMPAAAWTSAIAWTTAMANIRRNKPQQGGHNMSGLAPATPGTPATAKAPATVHN